jgi:ribosomal protein S4
MNPIRRRPDANQRRTNGVGGPKRSTERVGKSRPKRKTAPKRPARAKRAPRALETAPRTPKVTAPVASNLPGIRLNKYLADQRVSSRREADVLIATKKVLINGKVAKIGDRVQEGDEVTLGGETKSKRYLAYYKGRGIITHSPAAG